MSSVKGDHMRPRLEVRDLPQIIRESSITSSNNNRLPPLRMNFFAGAEALHSLSSVASEYSRSPCPIPETPETFSNGSLPSITSVDSSIYQKEATAEPPHQKRITVFRTTDDKVLLLTEKSIKSCLEKKTDEVFDSLNGLEEKIHTAGVHLARKTSFSKSERYGACSVSTNTVSTSQIRRPSCYKSKELENFQMHDYRAMFDLYNIMGTSHELLSAWLKIRSKLNELPSEHTNTDNNSDSTVAEFVAEEVKEVSTAPFNTERLNASKYSTKGFKKRRQKKSSQANSISAKSLHCEHCSVSETPEWRKGPYSAGSICNACGLFYKKLKNKFGVVAAGQVMASRKEKGRSLDRVIPATLNELY